MRTFLLTLIVVLFVTVPLAARPTLRGPGGLINVPTAYASSGGTVAPVTDRQGTSDTISSICYAWDEVGELSMQNPTKGASSFSLKYQLSQDKQTKNNEGTPAVALGFLDMANEDSKAFYGVMSKKSESAPFVLHAGLISERSLLGNIRFIGGFETPLSKQVLFLGEYDGMKRDINSGLVYHVTHNIGSFLYLMDVGAAGLQAEVTSGFTFKMAF